MQILYQEISRNHEITIYETMELFEEKGKFRVMAFSNQAMQGAMDLNHPERILFEYPRAIIHVMEANNPTFEDVFIIGHGIGTIAGHFIEKRFKVVELDRRVVELSRQYFGYHKENVFVGDGRTILESEERHAYHFIIVDAFTNKGTPRHLISKEFFRIAREKLESGGSLILNLVGTGQHDRLITAIHSTLSKEYLHTKCFSLPSERGTHLQNMILIGSDKPISFQLRHMAGFIEFDLD